uniref:Reverse transcriptase/retrotransposon-derived protein RNase H-like domain-containing protein n=1 Tax=Oncorhynchus tshawytscha TaxID=74940 RepID=A0AAZ3QB26_ONCTS
MVNQLAKFILQLAEKDKPLSDLLSKKSHWYWGADQVRAFKELKEELKSTPVLALFDPNKETKVSADESSYGLGGVLLLKKIKEWKPVAYASRSLTPTEQRHAQVEKEALGLIWACERFRDFLIGQHFQLETDHKPLQSLLGNQYWDNLPPQMQRFRMRLMTYSYMIAHVPGNRLWNADTLSLAPVKAKATAAKMELMERTNTYVNAIMEQLPAIVSYIDNLREQLKANSVCSNVMTMCQKGWSEFSGCEGLNELVLICRTQIRGHKPHIPS